MITTTRYCPRCNRVVQAIGVRSSGCLLPALIFALVVFSIPATLIFLPIGLLVLAMAFLLAIWWGSYGGTVRFRCAQCRRPL